MHRCKFAGCLLDDSDLSSHSSPELVAARAALHGRRLVGRAAEADDASVLLCSHFEVVCTCTERLSPVLLVGISATLSVRLQTIGTAHRAMIADAV